MKKLFFSFVIATMMTSLMACGGKTEQNAASQDSTVVEAEAADAPANNTRRLPLVCTYDTLAPLFGTWAIGASRAILSHVEPSVEDATIVSQPLVVSSIHA